MHKSSIHRNNTVLLQQYGAVSQQVTDHTTETAV